MEGTFFVENTVIILIIASKIKETSMISELKIIKIIKIIKNHLENSIKTVLVINKFIQSIKIITKKISQWIIFRTTH